jgi:LAS seventeen-binding protein 1/2
MNNDCKSAAPAQKNTLLRWLARLVMNAAEFFAGWRGRNERTGLEGIFPRSYVNIVEEKRPQAVSPHVSSYGNVPLDVSQSSNAMTLAEGKKPSKFEENGKKFGKKMGNAAIFGAGATIGSNIVNGIF